MYNIAVYIYCYIVVLAPRFFSIGQPAKQGHKSPWFGLLRMHFMRTWLKFMVSTTCIYLYTWIIDLCKIIARNPKHGNNYRRLSKFSPFPFFSPFQFPHFGLLIFVRRFVGFFRRFIGYFCRFKTAFICKMTKMQKLFGCRKKCRQQEIQKKK